MPLRPGGGAVRGVSSIAYAAAVTPTLLGNGDQVVNLGTLTGAITVNNPTGSPVDGQRLEFRVKQDATGTRVVTWGAAFVFGSDVLLASLPATANASYRLIFAWNASSSKWEALHLVRGF